MFTRMTAVVCLLTGLAAQPAPSRLSSFDRGNSLSMLKQIPPWRARSRCSAAR